MTREVRMICHGRVQNGRIVLDEGVTLPEGAEVSVEVRTRKRSEQSELVSSPIVPIQNCPRLFKFRCPKSWNALQVTDDVDVRFCSSCKKPVYFCDSQDDVERHQGHCIAVKIEPAKRTALDEDMYLGET